MAYHIHFGAGKLGLGFVLPILRDLQVPVAIFQRPNSPDWAKLSPKDNVIEFSVNSTSVLSCRYINDQCDPDTLKRYLEQRAHLFVSTSCIPLLQTVLRSALSISTAVGPQGLSEVIAGLELLPSYSRTVPVYCFENDFKAVDGFKDHLKKTIPDLAVISVMCDRICTAREISYNRVNVVTEEFAGSAVVFCSDHPCCNPFTSPGATRRACTPKTVVLAHNTAEENFYYNRKYSLLNGVHYTMAVFAYAALLEQGVPPNEWLDSPLAIWKNDKRNMEALNVLVEARILHLLHLTDSKTLATIYNTCDKKEIFQELKQLSSVILNRIASTDDTTGRILNLKNPTAIRSKYAQHFQPLQQFLTKGGDIQFADFGIARHGRYMAALRGWESRIKNSALAFGIDLSGADPAKCVTNQPFSGSIPASSVVQAR